MAENADAEDWYNSMFGEELSGVAKASRASMEAAQEEEQLKVQAAHRSESSGVDPYATPEDAGLVPAEAAAAPVADSEREAMGVRVQSLQNELAVQKAEVDRLATLNEQLSSRVASREGEVQDLRRRLAAALGREALPDRPSEPVGPSDSDLLASVRVRDVKNVAVEFVEDSPMFQREMEGFQEATEGLQSYLTGVVKSSRRLAQQGEAFNDATTQLISALGSRLHSRSIFTTSLPELGELHENIGRFASMMRDVQSCRAVLCDGLATMVTEPLERLGQEELAPLRELRGSCSHWRSRFEGACSRLVQTKATEDPEQLRLRRWEVAESRRAFHLVRFDLVRHLNRIEAVKKLRLMEAMTGAMFAHVSFFQSCADILSRAERTISDQQLQLARARRTLSQEDVIWSERRQHLSDALSTHRATPHAIGDDVALDVTSFSGARLAGLDGPVGLVLSPDRDAERRMMEEHLPQAAQAAAARDSAGSGREAAASELPTVPETGGDDEGEGEEGEEDEEKAGQEGQGEETEGQRDGSEAPDRKQSAVGAAAAALDGAGGSEGDTAGPQRRAEVQLQRMLEPGTGPLDKRGYLYVLESNFLKTWRRRWILVHAGKLFQMKSAKDTEPQLLCELLLSHVRPVRSGDMRNCFEVVCGRPQKTITFLATSEAEMLDWVTTLKEGTSRMLSSPSPHLSSGGNAALDGETRQIMQRVRSKNGACADCGAQRPAWVSLNWGVLLCINCSGIHRGLGSHLSKVKSLELDCWTVPQLGLLDEVGNTRANMVWEGSIPPGWQRPAASAQRSELQAYIAAKYRWRAFVRVPQPRPSKQDLSRQLYMATEGGELMKVYHAIVLGADVNWCPARSGPEEVAKAQGPSAPASGGAEEAGETVEATPGADQAEEAEDKEEEREDREESFGSTVVPTALDVATKRGDSSLAELLVLHGGVRKVTRKGSGGTDDDDDMSV